jgi:hypothetical protein
MFFGENEGIKKSGKSIKGNPTFKMFYRTLMILFNFNINTQKRKLPRNPSPTRQKLREISI